MNTNINMSNNDLHSHTLNKSKKAEKAENNFDVEENPWTIINSYFDNKHLKQLVKHQLESYNYFINSQIKDTIDMFNPICITSEQFYNREHKVNTLETVITFDNLSIHRPQLHENNGATRLMFPHDADYEILHIHQYVLDSTLNILLKKEKNINLLEK